LLIGLIGTSFVAVTLGAELTPASIATGSRRAGRSHLDRGRRLARRDHQSGLVFGDILGEYFTASTAATAARRMGHSPQRCIVAVGSVDLRDHSAGILAAVAPIIGLDPVLIALPRGAGSLLLRCTSPAIRSGCCNRLLGQSTAVP